MTELSWLGMGLIYIILIIPIILNRIENQPESVANSNSYASATYIDWLLFGSLVPIE